MAILYTITAYVPSIGGAQLHLHEFARRMQERYTTGVIYQWHEPRMDWLLGTTLRAPAAAPTQPRDGVPALQLSLSQQQRRRLAPWVWVYPLLQTRSIQQISTTLLDNLRDASCDLLGQTPTLIHNSRVGREGISMASLRLARELDIPFVFTPNHHHHWKGWFYRDYIKIYRAADAVVVYTDYEKSELIKLGVQPERIHTVGVGPILADQADGARFRQQHGIPPEAPMVLFLGQKFRYKRFEMLLEAMPAVRAQHPDTYFVFIGPRTEFSQKTFANVTDKHTLELDIVDLQTKTDALDACDILCVPSAKESFGGVNLEAWMMGKPVIAGDAPASLEIIRRSEGGFNASSDPDDLTHYLLKLLNDSALREALGSKGRRFAQQYNWNTLSARMAAIYTTLWGQSTSNQPISSRNRRERADSARGPDA